MSLLALHDREEKINVTPSVNLEAHGDMNNGYFKYRV